MKKILFALVAAAALLVGCQPKPVLVTGIKLSETTLNMVEGSTQHISAIVSPKEASNPELTWTSGNPSVATVTQSGDVTAVAQGEAKITVAATDGSGVTATCQVSVAKKVIPVSKIELNETTLSLNKGDQFQLEAVITPSDATYNHPKWVSSDPKVATVENGKVTAVAAGTANITAEAADESGVTSAPCVVTVLEPKPIIIKFSHMTLRVGASATEDFWYGETYEKRDRDNKPSFTWTSENASVATVDAAGKVTGVAIGETKVVGVDVSGAKVEIPVKVIATTPTDEYNYGIPVMDLSRIDAGSGSEYYDYLKLKTSKVELKDGFVSGTKRYGATISEYRFIESSFSRHPVNASQIKNPALFIRVFISDPTKLKLSATNVGEIELRSHGSATYAEGEELCWPMARWCADADGAVPEAKHHLTAGWNNIVLPFDKGTKSDDNRFDPAHISFFRIYQGTSGPWDPVDIVLDQVRIVDWTEFETCDNFDVWYDGGTGNNRPIYEFDSTGQKEGAGCFSATDDFLFAAISAFRLKMSMAPWQYREYCLPYDMDESNTRVSFWLWVDDAAWFNQQIWEFEIASTGVNNENNWIWQHNSTDSNLVNGWNKITEDLSNASGGGKRNPRVINYARFVMQTANPTGRHTYKIDDIRFEKK